jgi:hypothetical protein
MDAVMSHATFSGFDDLGEKVIGVRCSHSRDGDIVLYHVTTKTILGKTVICGRVPPCALTPAFTGVEVIVAWDDVQQIYVFDDIGHFERAETEFEKQSSPDRDRKWYARFFPLGRPREHLIEQR